MRLEMPRLLSIAFVLAAALAAGVASPRPAAASGAPWCAVQDIGWGNQITDCSFWTQEQCLPFVLGGNRGFCNRNPDYTGPTERRRVHHRRHHRRY
jgi:hypothetical protein